MILSLNLGTMSKVDLIVCSRIIGIVSEKPVAYKYLHEYEYVEELHE